MSDCNLGKVIDKTLDSCPHLLMTLCRDLYKVNICIRRSAFHSAKLQEKILLDYKAYLININYYNYKNNYITLSRTAASVEMEMKT